MVIGGDIYRGGNQNAGEAGHITVDVSDAPVIGAGTLALREFFRMPLAGTGA